MSVHGRFGAAHQQFDSPADLACFGCPAVSDFRKLLSEKGCRAHKPDTPVPDQDIIITVRPDVQTPVAPGALKLLACFRSFLARITVNPPSRQLPQESAALPVRRQPRQYATGSRAQKCCAWADLGALGIRCEPAGIEGAGAPSATGVVQRGQVVHRAVLMGGRRGIPPGIQAQYS